MARDTPKRRQRGVGSYKCPTGRELFAELVDVDEAPLGFELHGVCAYESTFTYSSDN